VSEHKIPDVENVFKQLDAGLCLVARVKGENPQKQYFFHSTPNVAKLQLDGGTYQLVLTKVDEEEAKKDGG
jgi:hypothetical protein